MNDVEVNAPCVELRSKHVQTSAEKDSASTTFKVTGAKNVVSVLMHKHLAASGALDVK